VKTTTVLWAALAAAAALHVGVVSQDFATLAKNGFLYDDSFYAFQIARNIAAGSGVTFDGIHVTNGFQPLYVALLVPLYLIFGGAQTAPIHAVLVLMALATVASAWLLYRIVARYVRRGAAVAVALLWVFAPVVIRQSANGLETALALLLLAASVDFYLSRIRPVERPRRRAFAAMGLLLALAVLARVDQIFLVLAMTLDYLLVLRRPPAPGRANLRGLLLAAAVTTALVAPWPLFGALAVGSPFPQSGTATRYLSLAYAPHFHMAGESIADTGPTAAFLWAHVEHSLSVLKLNPFTHTFFRALEKVGAAVSAQQAARAAAGVAGVCMLLAAGAWLARRLRRSGHAARELAFLLLYAVTLIAAYSFYVFGSFFFVRYYYPLFFVAAIFGALMVEEVMRAWPRAGAGIRRVAAVGVLAYVLAFAYMSYSSGFRSTPAYHFYDVARWVSTHTAEDDTVGTFQSGAIGYLSGRRVVNLDGKVNGEALAALRAGKMGAYVESAGIDFIVDHGHVLSLFLARETAGLGARVATERRLTGADLGAPGWVGYHLVPRLGGRAAPDASVGPPSSPGP
jgi:4-amino-4-deoxy-L-arabinose transferase-like glycosyltransferase